MRVVISAGGTGGHIYPALAIINKIKEKEPNSEFLYIGTHNRMEKDIIPNYGIPFEQIEIYGFYRKALHKNIKTVSCMLKGYKKCKKLIREFKPDVVIGVGGYVTAPVIRAAKKLEIPTFIHEQNSVPGASNLYLSKLVDKIGVSLKSSMDKFPKEKVVFTGNPCSSASKKVKAASKKEFGLDPKKKLILFVMGSLGSSKMNEILCATMNQFKGKQYEILFVTGKGDYDNIKSKKFPTNIKVVPYVENLPRLMKKTDIMVTRAGASTLSEIIALEIPSILVPSPYVPNNHQFKNAMDLVDAKAAILVEEKDLKENRLVDEIDKLISDEKKCLEMKKHLRQLGIEDSAEVIYRELQKLVSKG